MADKYVQLKDRQGNNLYPVTAGGGGGGTSDYENLNNKPRINSVTLIGNKTSVDLGLATKTSDLTNDSYYVSDPFYEHDESITNAEIEAILSQ